MGTSDLLTTGQVAASLGTSRQHVVDLCDSGRLRHVRVGTHRRIPSREVARWLGPSISTDLSPERERSWWLHVAVVGELVVDPARVVATARDNVVRWRELHRPDGRTHQALLQWEEILDADIPALVAALTDRSDLGCELRQNSPFAGVLDPTTRATTLSAFEAYPRAGSAS